MVLMEEESEYDTLAHLREVAATDSEEEEADKLEDSNSSGDDGSYHSDNDEIAEYWDPYCELC